MGIPGTITQCSGQTDVPLRGIVDPPVVLAAATISDWDGGLFDAIIGLLVLMTHILHRLLPLTQVCAQGKRQPFLAPVRVETLLLVQGQLFPPGQIVTALWTWPHVPPTFAILAIIGDEVLRNSIALANAGCEQIMIMISSAF